MSTKVVEQGTEFSYTIAVDGVKDGETRTASIMGKVRNLPSTRYRPQVEGIGPFEHAGHLIAVRFGGPNRKSSKNIVPMHGAVNQAGGEWYRLEQDIAKLLGDDAGTMVVELEYDGVLDTVPLSFSVWVGVPDGRRLSRRIYNGNPLLLPLHFPERLRATIISRLVCSRRLKVDTEARKRINACQSVEVLARWCDRALEVDRVGDLFS
jgi:hypothetical protein